MIGFCGVWCVYDILIGSLWPTRLLWQNHFYAPRDLACHFDVPFRFKAISDMAYQRNREALGFDHRQLYPISELTSALRWGLERKRPPCRKQALGQEWTPPTRLTESGDSGWQDGSVCYRSLSLLPWDWSSWPTRWKEKTNSIQSALSSMHVLWHVHLHAETHTHTCTHTCVHLII